MTLEMAVQIITILLFVGTALIAAVKYGADQQKIKSDIASLRNDLKNMIENFKEEKEHNQGQHETFYQNRNDTIEIKTNMAHIMSAIIDIKNLLGDRRSQP